MNVALLRSSQEDKEANLENVGMGLHLYSVHCPSYIRLHDLDVTSGYGTARNAVLARSASQKA